MYNKFMWMSRTASKCAKEKKRKGKMKDQEVLARGKENEAKITI